jgi:hypothetical protein
VTEVVTPERAPPRLPCEICGSADGSLTLCGGCVEAARQLVPGRPPAATTPPDPRLGRCSFCSSEPLDAHAMFVGPPIYGEPIRLCDQCLDLCCDIVAERRVGESWLAPKPVADCPACRLPRPLSSVQAACVSCFARARAPAEVRRSDMRAVEVLIPPLPPPAPGGEFTCAFCFRPRSLVRGLVSGPRVFVCEQCITEFAVELEPHYWWSWERPGERKPAAVAPPP